MTDIPPRRHETEKTETIDLKDGSVKRDEYLLATLFAGSEAIG